MPSLKDEIGEMSQIKDLHRRWSKDADYHRAYKALEPEFELAGAVIESRGGSDRDSNAESIRAGLKKRRRA